MENTGNLMKVFAVLFLAISLLGCSLDPRDIEIKRLENALSEQLGNRQANLEFAERQVGIYQGCIFLFNICPASALEKGKIAIKYGYTGASSYWFWLPVIGKLFAIAVFLGTMLWVTLHLTFTFTQPIQTEINAAKALIADAQAQEEIGKKRISASQRLVDIAEKKSLDLDKKNIEKSEKLMVTEKALKVRELQLAAAEKKLEDMRVLQAAFKRF